MNKPSIFVFALVLLFQVNNLFSQEDINEKPKSIAAVLSITGDGHKTDAIKTVLVKIYDGKAKPLNGMNSIRTNDILIIRAINEKGTEVFAGYYDNPLVENKEIYTQDGLTADNVLAVLKEGSINVRFPIQSNNGGNLILKCYQKIDEQPEKLLTTISLNQ